LVTCSSAAACWRGGGDMYMWLQLKAWEAFYVAPTVGVAASAPQARGGVAIAQRPVRLVVRIKPLAGGSAIVPAPADAAVNAPGVSALNANTLAAAPAAAASAATAAAKPLVSAPAAGVPAPPAPGAIDEEASPMAATSGGDGPSPAFLPPCLRRGAPQRQLQRWFPLPPLWLLWPPDFTTAAAERHPGCGSGAAAGELSDTLSAREAVLVDGVPMTAAPEALAASAVWGVPPLRGV